MALHAGIPPAWHIAGQVGGYPAPRRCIEETPHPATSPAAFTTLRFAAPRLDLLSITRSCPEEEHGTPERAIEVRYTMAAGSSGAIIERSMACLDIFDALVLTCAGDSWFENQRMRLDLWAAKLGVLESETLSIKHRLRRNATAGQAILQIVDAMACNLVSCIALFNIAPACKLTVLVTRNYDNDLVSRVEGSVKDLLSSHELHDVDNPLLAALKAIVDDTETRRSLGKKPSKDVEMRKRGLKDRISKSIGDLLRIAFQIRRYKKPDWRARGATYSPNESDNDCADDLEPGPQSRIPLSLQFQRYVKYVLDHEITPKRAQLPETTYLQERLSHTMMTRWRQTCYLHSRGRRGQKLSHQRSDARASTTSSAPHGPQSGEAAQNVVEHENAGVTLLTSRTMHASSILSGATTLPSTYNPLQTSKQQTTSVTSTLRAYKADLELPALPPERLEDKEYQYDCPYCDTVLLKETRLSQRAWRKHLWYDLQPYQCLFEVCTSLDLFSSTSEWTDHCRSHLDTKWVCSLCRSVSSTSYASTAHRLPTSVFGSEDDFVQHMIVAHSVENDKGTLTMIARYSKENTTLDACLICGAEQGLTGSGVIAESVSATERQRNIEMCMINHLETLALASLPWHFNANKTTGSNDAAQSGAGDSRSKQISETSKLEGSYNVTVDDSGGSRTTAVAEAIQEAEMARPTLAQIADAAEDIGTVDSDRWAPWLVDDFLEASIDQGDQSGTIGPWQSLEAGQVRDVATQQKQIEALDDKIKRREDEERKLASIDLRQKQNDENATTRQLLGRSTDEPTPVTGVASVVADAGYGLTTRSTASSAMVSDSPRQHPDLSAIANAWDVIGSSPMTDAVSLRTSEGSGLESSLERTTNSDGRAALQVAAGGGHLEVVDRLLAAKADVTAPVTFNGQTAFQAAAGGGHPGLANTSGFLSKAPGVQRSTFTANSDHQTHEPLDKAESLGPRHDRSPPGALTFAEALDYMEKTRNKQQHVDPPEHLSLSKLRGRDHVIFVDDSSSMWAEYQRDPGTNKPNVRALIKLLSWMIKNEVPDGVDLHFFKSSNVRKKCKSSAALVDMVRATDFGGMTNPCHSLKPFLESYRDQILAYKRNLNRPSWKLLFGVSKEPRPLSVYVLTDGVWESPNDSDITNFEYLDHTIVTLVEALVTAGLERNQLGIQFISFGKHTYGQARLNHLDVLNKTSNLSLDIIDTEPSDGNIWKMLLGAINPRFDCDVDGG